MYNQHIWFREKERWLFDEVVDHVGINGSKGAEGLSAFKFGLVVQIAADTLGTQTGQTSPALVLLA